MNTANAHANAALGTTGWTPLIIASLKENPELVEVLLRAPDIDVNAVTEDGMTALFEASTQGGDSIGQKSLFGPFFGD